MASLIIFLCFAAFMFAAGYQWRKLRETHGVTPQAGGPASLPAPAREALWDGMLRKM